MKKVVILCANYERGGAQLAALRLNGKLNLQGFDSSCWFMHRWGNDFSNIKPIILVEKTHMTFFSVSTLIIRLFKKIRKEKPDVLITFLPWANIIGTIIAKLSGVKVRIASHRNEFDKDSSRIMIKVDKFLADKNIYTSITAVSEATKQTYCHYNKSTFDKIKVIHNGLNFETSHLSPIDAKHKFCMENKFTIGAIGRLTYQKNHTFLIDLLPKLEGVNLVIVGVGVLYDKLIQQASDLQVLDRIKIIPEMSRADMPDFFQAIDVYVMPSLFEGLSNALVEALHAGKAIVASDVPSQREVLYKKENSFYAGELITLIQPELWIESIDKIKKNITYRNFLMEKSRLRSQDFTLDNMVNQYTSLFP